MSEKPYTQEPAQVTANIFNLPIGTIMAYGGPQTAMEGLKEQGWLPCTGGTASKTKWDGLWKLLGNSCGTASADDFYLPDLRGQFLRGLSTDDNIDANSRTAQGSGGNAGPLVLSRQGDDMKAHTHTVHTASLRENKHFAVTSDHYQAATTMETYTSSSFGNKENRPKNVYVHYIIFAGLPKTV